MAIPNRPNTNKEMRRMLAIGAPFQQQEYPHTDYQLITAPLNMPNVFQIKRNGITQPGVLVFMMNDRIHQVDTGYYTGTASDRDMWFVEIEFVNPIKQQP